MKRTTRFLSCLLLPFLLAACTPQVTDDTVFNLYYYNIGLTPGETVNISPSYIGTPPTGFRIYSITRNGKVFYEPRLDGELTEDDSFYINPSDGRFSVQNTIDLATGTYSVSLTCTSGGVEYDYPGIITVEIKSAE